MMFNPVPKSLCIYLTFIANTHTTQMEGHTEKLYWQMNAWTAVNEPYIRPTARLNSWTPHIQLHGSGTKFIRSSLYSASFRRRTATAVRRQFHTKSLISASHTVQRSQSMDNLNLVQVTNPEVLDFVQKRQLVSDHIRAKRISIDENVVRSRGLYCHISEMPSGELTSAVRPRECTGTLGRRITTRTTTVDYYSGVVNRMRKDQEQLRAFYSSLTTEVLPAPLPVHLSVRKVNGVTRESDLVSTAGSHEWQSVGQGHLVIIAHYTRHRWRELSNITVQLCQPTIFTPLWCAHLALPLSKSRSSEHKYRLSARSKLNGIDDPDQKCLLYSRGKDTNVVHFAYVYQPPSRGRLNATSLLPAPGFKNSTAAANGLVYMVSRWKFICDGFELGSAVSVELDAFFFAMKKFISHALVSQLAISFHCFLRFVTNVF